MISATPPAAGRSGRAVRAALEIGADAVEVCVGGWERAAAPAAGGSTIQDPLLCRPATWSSCTVKAGSGPLACGPSRFHSEPAGRRRAVSSRSRVAGGHRSHATRRWCSAGRRYPAGAAHVARPAALSWSPHRPASWVRGAALSPPRRLRAAGFGSHRRHADICRRRLKTRLGAGRVRRQSSAPTGRRTVAASSTTSGPDSRSKRAASGETIRLLGEIGNQEEEIERSFFGRRTDRAVLAAVRPFFAPGEGGRGIPGPARSRPRRERASARSRPLARWPLPGLYVDPDDIRVNVIRILIWSPTGSAGVPESWWPRWSPADSRAAVFRRRNEMCRKSMSAPTPFGSAFPRLFRSPMSEMEARGPRPHLIMFAGDGERFRPRRPESPSVSGRRSMVVVLETLLPTMVKPHAEHGARLEKPALPFRHLIRPGDPSVKPLLSPRFFCGAALVRARSPCVPYRTGPPDRRASGLVVGQPSTRVSRPSGGAI